MNRTPREQALSFVTVFGLAALALVVGCQSAAERKAADLQALYDQAVEELEQERAQKRTLKRRVAQLEKAETKTKESERPDEGGYPVTRVLLDFPQAGQEEVSTLVESARRLGGTNPRVEVGPEGVTVALSGRLFLTRKRLIKAFARSGWLPLDEILIPFEPAAGHPRAGIELVLRVQGYDPGARLKVGGLSFVADEEGRVRIKCRVSQSDGRVYFRRNPGTPLRPLKTLQDGDRRYILVEGQQEGEPHSERLYLP